MSRVGAAAPAEDRELRMVGAKSPVQTRQLDGVTRVERVGLIQFSVALA